MSQHDFVISDQGMPAARADLNAGLQALASLSKGPAAPTSLYAGQLWLDDDTPSASVWTLNVYDGVDWIPLGQLNTTTNVFTPTNAAMLNLANAFTKTQSWFRGADLASAAALTLGDGNIFNVTGTTAITSIGTKGVGTIVFLRFTAALTLTHHATNLVLIGAANITTAAGDYAILEEYGVGTWRMVAYQRASGAPLSGAGKLKQRVYATYATYTSTSAVIPNDDTIPQITEGAETVTATITPLATTNILRVTAFANASGVSGNLESAIALFRDAVANAKAAVRFVAAASHGQTVSLVFEEVAGSLAATTYRLRIGPIVAATIYINGDSAARKFGGVHTHQMIIDEIEP